MTLTHGNDPEILDGIGDALQVEAERVQGIAGSGASGIAALVESWAGPDLEVFDANWRGAQQQLDAAAQLLRAVGERAKEQAQQQREGSGEGGGGKGTPWLPTTPGADNTLPTPGTPNTGDNSLPSPDDPALVAPIKHDTPPDSGGDTRPDPDSFELTDERSDGAKIPLAGTEWVPQGMSVAEGRGQGGDDLYAYTYYHEDDTTDGKIVFADEDGNIVSEAPLSGQDHYGGVFVNGKYTYVSGDDVVKVYKTNGLMKAGGEPVDVEHTIDTAASSTVTVHDDHLYVTEFTEQEVYEQSMYAEMNTNSHMARGSMYAYPLMANGDVGENYQPDGEYADDVPRYEVPPRTQGVSFDEAGNAYFSTSSGRLLGSPSELWMVPADKLGDWSDDDATKIDLPKMAEGSFIRDGQLHQLYESGADKYHMNGFLTDPRDRTTIHDLRK